MSIGWIKCKSGQAPLDLQIGDWVERLSAGKTARFEIREVRGNITSKYYFRKKGGASGWRESIVAYKRVASAKKWH